MKNMINQKKMANKTQILSDYSSYLLHIAERFFFY